MSCHMRQALDEVEALYFAGVTLSAAIEKVSRKYSGIFNIRREANVY
jgi:hypothetical protein